MTPIQKMINDLRVKMKEKIRRMCEKKGINKYVKIDEIIAKMRNIMQ